MYAIIQTGGKQYKVTNATKQTEFKCELLEGEVGSKVTFDALLYSDDKGVVIGKDAGKIKVVTEIVEHGKGQKISIFTYKAKKNIRHRQGHRQPYTKLRVLSIGK